MDIIDNVIKHIIRHIEISNVLNGRTFEFSIEILSWNLHMKNGWISRPSKHFEVPEDLSLSNSKSLKTSNFERGPKVCNRKCETESAKSFHETCWTMLIHSKSEFQILNCHIAIFNLPNIDCNPIKASSKRSKRCSQNWILKILSHEKCRKWISRSPSDKLATASDSQMLDLMVR